MKTKTIISFLLFLLFFISSQAQCAMCRAVLESEEGKGTAEAVNNGIMYLMIIPYILVALTAFFIYKTYKKKA